MAITSVVWVWCGMSSLQLACWQANGQQRWLSIQPMFFPKRLGWACFYRTAGHEPHTSNTSSRVKGLSAPHSGQMFTLSPACLISFAGHEPHAAWHVSASSPPTPSSPTPSAQAQVGWQFTDWAVLGHLILLSLPLPGPHTLARRWLSHLWFNFPSLSLSQSSLSFVWVLYGLFYEWIST